ncbi:hypothetical protein DSECCO2_644450 [anaerobic digester metagenome]
MPFGGSFELGRLHPDAPHKDVNPLIFSEILPFNQDLLDVHIRDLDGFQTGDNEWRRS